MSNGLEALMALGGGGGMPPGGPPGGAPAGPPPAPPEEPAAEGDTADLIREAMSILEQAIQVEDSDQTKLGLEDVMTKLQKVLAQEEQEQEQALQGKMSPKLLRKSYGA